MWVAEEGWFVTLPSGWETNPNPDPSPNPTLTLTLTLTLTRFAALPSGWEMRKDPEGLVYFYDEPTGLSSRQVALPLPLPLPLTPTLTLTLTLTPTLTLTTGLSSRQSPADDHYRSMYYSHKYAEAENGAYVTQLLSCAIVSSAIR